MGPSHCMNSCSPPTSRTNSSPGRRGRWYALARIICARIACRSVGSSALTVARVPTAMNAGVTTTPCGVANRAARAAPDVVSREKSKLTGSGSDDGHRVTVRIEAIALGDRLPVRAHREIVSGDGRDEHDQRRARKMEVRDDRVDGAQLRGRTNEDARLAAAGVDVSGVVGGALERAHGGGADCPHAAALGARSRVRL